MYVKDKPEMYYMERITVIILFNLSIDVCIYNMNISYSHYIFKLILNIICYHFPYHQL